METFVFFKILFCFHEESYNLRWLHIIKILKWSFCKAVWSRCFSESYIVFHFKFSGWVYQNMFQLMTLIVYTQDISSTSSNCHKQNHMVCDGISNELINFGNCSSSPKFHITAVLLSVNSEIMLKRSLLFLWLFHSLHNCQIDNPLKYKFVCWWFQNSKTHLRTFCHISQVMELRKYHLCVIL